MGQKKDDDPFGFGAFSELFDTAGKLKTVPKEEKKPEKAPVWNAKEIDGKRYVSLEQVLQLLEMNDVLPAVQKGLRRRVKPDAEANG